SLSAAFGTRSHAAQPAGAPASGRCPRPRGSRPRPSLDRGRRQREREGAALPELAVHPDAPPVELDEALRQGQPQAGAVTLLLAGGGLLELLEDPRLILGRDARPRVGDGDPQLAILPGGTDGHGATRGRELDRVGEQVERYLPDPALVADHRVDRGVGG